MMKTRLNRVMMAFAVFWCLLASPTPSNAQTSSDTRPDLSAFSAWPVLHDGRLKTMESFARSIFFRVAGQTELNGTSAVEWLANSLFDPASTINDPYIYIPRVSILDLPDNGTKYYSMNDVMRALNPHQDLILSIEQRDPATLSASQKDLITIYDAVVTYNQIIQSYSALLPLRGYDGKTFLDGAGTDTQRALIVAGGRENALLKMIPHDNPTLPRVTVWQAIGLDLQDSAPLVDQLQNMAKAWNASDYQTWENLSNHVLDDLLMIANERQDLTNKTRLMIEHAYVLSQPILWAMGFYVLCMVLCFIPSLPYQWVAMRTALTIGWVAHLVDLGARCYILSRPPTGTLYETLLFAAFIIASVVMGFVWKKSLNHKPFIAIALGISTLILWVSRGFVEGDSLNVLVAVLNTNFWLSTHVTCIIFGYAFTMLAAAAAHYYLWTKGEKAKSIMLPLALIALLFTAVGTLLGGIWADQSWGRFWGWDPKENGALLIVLWLVWVLHGRISGHFKPLVFGVMLALSNIMVALTWFGVNLLGVGLHSYGFINGIAWGLFGFITVQITVVGWLYWRAHKQNQKKTKAS